MGHAFRLPDVGEGLTEAEIARWLVAVGDRVEVNTPIVEIETAKSLVELPSPAAGVVARLLVAEGELVPVGTPIIEFGEAALADTDPAPGAAPGEPSPAADPPPRQLSTASPSAGPGQAILVGYGPRAGGARSRRRGRPAAPAKAPVEIPVVVPAQPTGGSARALAKPPVRKLARDLGVDLQAVVPSGPGGVVTRDDVTAAAGPPAPAPAVEPVGRETRTPVRGVRRATAQAMVASAFSAPHVSVWTGVDVTRTLRMLARLRNEPELAGLSVGPLLAIARALLGAVRRHPQINASWDEPAGEIVTRHYVNLGVAAATERGLLVPVVRDADRRSLPDLAAELARVIGVARDGSATPADLTGGTISITNIGVFGVDGGTPILPPGQSAILAVGQIRQQPWVHKGRVTPRSVLQLTVSFDHRIVDGELGSRFLADVAATLERPERGNL